MTTHNGPEDPTPPDGGSGDEKKPQSQSTPLDSDSLFGKNDVLLIEHEGTTYLLRKTRQGKLILTK